MSVAQQVGTWAGRFGLRRKLAIALAAAALASGIATYLALTGAPPFGPHPVVVLSLLNMSFYTGRSGPLNWLLPSTDLVFVLLGLSRALWLRRNDLPQYLKLGHWGERP